jgi:RHS repeat-associated protein
VFDCAGRGVGTIDAIGSTRQLSNTAGSVTDTLIYDAWGNIVSRTGTTGVVFLWIGVLGYYIDAETGLVYVRQRIYGPAVARWTSQDAAALTVSPNSLEFLLRFVSASVAPRFPTASRVIVTPQTSCRTFRTSDLETPAQTNVYGYAQNAPLSLTDPTGLLACPTWSIRICNPRTPPIDVKSCRWLDRIGGFCCSASCAAAAAACCALDGEVLEHCRYSPTWGLASFDCKKPKWKGSCKARGCCPPQCGIFRATGDTQKECEDAAFAACVAAGCHKPDAPKETKCECGHAHCHETS